MRKGFTLIELLIVVAIIAILAAIAVPNFLEAQVRAKVSRTKADMRTLATALESYTVDTNHTMTIQLFGVAPIALNGPSVVNPALSGNAWGSPRYIRLTTPIAYITSVLSDPFAKDGLTIIADATLSPNYDTYDYIDAYDLMPGALLDTNATTTWRGAGVTSGGGWRMASAGPDRIQAFGGSYVGQTNNNYGVDYDPTNGTVSRGDIVRIGGGAGPINPNKLPSIDRVRNVYNEAGL